MRVPREITNEWLDPKFMARFLRAPYDERRGVLRMLHAAHEGLDQGDLVVMPVSEMCGDTADLSDAASQPTISTDDFVCQKSTPGWVERNSPEPPIDRETAYSALEAQAAASLVQPQPHG